MSKKPLVGILGTGAWGTVFSQVVLDTGAQVKLWGRNPHTVSEITGGQNSRYVPGIDLRPQTQASTDLAWVCQDIDALVVAIPSESVREVLEQVRPVLAPEVPVISLVKGVEAHTDLLMTQVIAQALEKSESQIVALSGPNLSLEIARRQPTGAVLACSDEATANAMGDLCHTEYFRPYISTDVVGCEVAGATKNVVAMALGAAEGMGLGTNSRAMLMTRGMAEMTRLGVALGADPQTFMGMAGMGDLVATCSSKLSRNYTFGFNVGSGMTVSQALQASAGVVEGARSCRQILAIGQRYGIDQPLCAGVVQAIYHGANLGQLARDMMLRERKMDGYDIRLLSEGKED